MSRTPHALAFIVATKDRPQDLRKLLASLSAQTVRPEQVILVDGGTLTVEDVAGEFSTALSISSRRHWPPSAAQQRNAGLSLLAGDIDLVGFLDDDTTLPPDAVERMLAFWRTTPSDTGGAAFNWLNSPARGLGWLKLSRFSVALGLYDRSIGRVAPSGWASVAGKVEGTCFVAWLPSGASVWRREVFNDFRFDEFFDGYSYLEDLDFSYSVGRRWRLAIVAEAGFCHYPSPAGRSGAYRFGKVEVRNRLYFVRKHGLSLWRCRLGLLVRLAMTLGSALWRRDSGYLERARGNFAAMLKDVSGRRVPV